LGKKLPFSSSDIPIVRLSGSMDGKGMITQTAEAGNRQPDGTTIAMQIARNEIKRKL